MSMENALAPKRRTQYLPHLGLPDKVVQSEIVCNDWDIEPLDLLNRLALGCYQILAIAIYINNCFYCCYVKCATKIVREWQCLGPKQVLLSTHYNAQC